MVMVCYRGLYTLSIKCNSSSLRLRKTINMQSCGSDPLFLKLLRREILFLIVSDDPYLVF